MTKLIIQIPCFNEEATLGLTLAALPREIEGVDVVEWMVVDDGSTDATQQVAKEHDVDHIISIPRNRGLAQAFMSGLEHAIKLNADIIVNTDADNQYNADDIPTLIAPILRGEAEIVIGERPIDHIAHFSQGKKLLQKLGSWVVRMASGTSIPDAPSGFRALSREAAMRMHVFTNYTYTLETIIQAGRKNMAVTSVPVRVNEALRPSRLVKSTPAYLRESLITIVRIFMIYRPFRFFALPGGIFFTLGLYPMFSFLYFFVTAAPDEEVGHVPSLLFGVSFMLMGVALFIVALLGDLIAVNRMLLEDLRWRYRERDYREQQRKQ